MVSDRTTGNSERTHEDSDKSVDRDTTVDENELSRPHESESSLDPTEEWDPEAEFTDPESDSLTIPAVETEDAGSSLHDDLVADHELDSIPIPEVSTTESDVPSELLNIFWGLVLVINAAVLALSLGLLFLFFEGVSTHGVGLVIGGVVLFGFAYRRYRTYQARSDEFTSDGETAGDSEQDPASSDGAARNTDAGKSTSGDGAEQRIPGDSDRS
ncbi:DUF7322 domain-containing protein [Natrialba taiwanensis]|uniref:DUF7322 domain-containing protein n=1 Tax=Natrialba taiwanensis DSM 12281 TaxID=1230458 RepID=M0A1Q2_9EURY|nr:hypothetical protein [Natrialba taiwanensis]ELY92685.1 hypothetical protein C484_08653 [Natrialba taiwanensis DSM 12281]